MVEIKEEIELILIVFVTYRAVTQHYFFNLYNKILGVTGIVGTEKQFIMLKFLNVQDIF